MNNKELFEKYMPDIADCIAALKMIEESRDDFDIDDLKIKASLDMLRVIEESNFSDESATTIIAMISLLLADKVTIMTGEDAEKLMSAIQNGDYHNESKNTH